MRDPIVIEGGWYGDYLPSGELAVPLRGQNLVATHLGNVFTKENFLWCRVAKDPFRFAGQKADEGPIQGDGNYEWFDQNTRRVGDSFGVNSVIYQRGHLIQAVASHQGFRFVDDADQLVTGDQSMFDPINQINEYTDKGGVRFGQGQEGNCIVIIDGKRRKLESGDCFNIRVNMVDNLFTISVDRFSQKLTKLFLRTREELSSLPLAPIVVPHDDAPHNDHHDIPHNDEVIMAPESQLPTVERIRSKYPTPLGERHWEFLVEVAKETKTLLFRKEDSNSVLIPALGKRVSLDIIGRGVLGDWWIDILVDSEKNAFATWQEHQYGFVHALKSPLTSEGLYSDRLAT